MARLRLLQVRLRLLIPPNLHHANHHLSLPVEILHRTLQLQLNMLLIEFPVVGTATITMAAVAQTIRMVMILC